MRKILSIFAILFAFPVSAGSVAVLRNAAPIVWDSIQNQNVPPWIAYTRGSSGTDGLITDAAGSSNNTYGNNVAIFYQGKGFGMWDTRTQYLLNSAVPANQTTGVLTAGTYQFWCIGSGSVTTALVAGAGSGFGSQSCSTGTAQAITATGGSTTVSVTITGSVDRFQIENGAFPTPFIVSTGTTATRSADIASFAIPSRPPYFWIRNHNTTVVIEAQQGSGTGTGSSMEIIAATSGSTGIGNLIRNASFGVATSSGASTITGASLTWSNVNRIGLATDISGRTLASSAFSSLVSDLTYNSTNPTNVYIGGQNGLANFNGYIRKLAISNHRISNSALQNEMSLGSGFQ